MTSRLYRSVLAVLVLYWLAIFVASHLPPGSPHRVHVNDKLQHFAAYTMLTVLLSIALSQKRPRGDWVTILIVLIYAAIDETLQPLVNRQAELLDWFADAAGAAVGVCICGAWRFAYGRVMGGIAPARELQEA